MIKQWYLHYIKNYLLTCLQNEDKTKTGTDLAPKRTLQEAAMQFKMHLF
jgi:hypothetical protein